MEQSTCCEDQGTGCGVPANTVPNLQSAQNHTPRTVKDPPLICLDHFDDHAVKVLPKAILDFFRSGANDEQTLDDNKIAYRRWRLRPRLLRDVSHRDLRTTILGHPIDFPICIAPTALHRMAHLDGESATAKAAQSVNTCFTLSAMSSMSIEDVAKAAPEALMFLQVSLFKDKEVVKELIRRAEGAGFKAIVVTIDQPMAGRRVRYLRSEFKLPPGIKFANFKNMSDARGFDQSTTWKGITQLKEFTNLPVMVKGVLSGADAELAVESGVDGIIVSNHGGRQLDGVLATIDALPEVVAAVKGRCEVYLDGGVRLGTDVFKALALGARAVFIGRSVIYGLAYNGEDSVKKVLEMLRDELDLAMALSGTPTLKDINREMLIHESEYMYPKP